MIEILALALFGIILIRAIGIGTLLALVAGLLLISTVLV